MAVRLVLESGDTFADVGDKLGLVTDQGDARARYRNDDEVRGSVGSEREAERFSGLQAPRAAVARGVHVGLAGHSQLSGREGCVGLLRSAVVTEDIGASQRTVIGVSRRDNRSLRPCRVYRVNRNQSS